MVWLILETMATSLLVVVVALMTVAPALANASVTLSVNASDPGQQMPSTLFGLFFEVLYCPTQSET